MILRRLGNKTRIAKKIQEYFPPHKLYIEPFFGAGGMFFNKPKAKYNIVNDLDSDVFNLYQVIKTKRKELEKALYYMPVHSDLFKYYQKNEMKTDIDKAVRFLFLSNFGYMGKANTLRLEPDNTKRITINNINITFDLIFDVQFANYDYYKFLNSITYKNKKETFIYCDPPYIGTTNNYSNGFTKSDVIRLFDILQEVNCKFAYSEFDNPFILEQAKQRKLNIITIGKRINLKNERTEILITNYEKHPTLF